MSKAALDIPNRDQLNSRNIGGWEFLQSVEMGIAPIFTIDVRRRILQKKACNIIVTGEAGCGKTYLAMQVCRHLKRGWGDPQLDKFKYLDPTYFLAGLVFTYKQYLQILMKVGMGYPLCFDEPSYAMGKREWYKQINQALVKTIESARFMVKPLVIPIINQSLLDKTLRSYLIQYLVVLNNRGRGIVYTITASPFQDKVYKKFLCKVRYGMMDNYLCDKDSCLGCRKFNDCQHIRARYERKKRDTQYTRYEQDLEEANAIEGSKLTLEQLCKLVVSIKDKVIDKDGKLNVAKMKAYLKTDYDIKIGNNKSYDLKQMLHVTYPDLFPESD